MSLYLKYRPTSLSEIKGNYDILPALSKMLEKGVEGCPHAFMLTGPSGCGKTTIGRIIASELGCVGSDFREIDSADFRGIDTVREIRKNSQYKPIEGPCRVWLMDEYHKNSNDAMNALLKILEDTPPHVFFILCTSEPNKVIAPIKNRCSQFQVKPLSEKDMMGLLKEVAKAEGEKITEEFKTVLDQIVQDSMGQSRNALQILDQVLATPKENRLAIAQHTAEQQSQMIDLCRALIKKAPWKNIAKILEGLKEEEPESIRRVVLGYCQAILIKGSADNHIASVMEAFIDPFYDTGFPKVVFACYSAIN